MKRSLAWSLCIASCLLAGAIPPPGLGASEPEVSPAATSVPQPSTSPGETSGALRHGC